MGPKDSLPSLQNPPVDPIVSQLSAVHTSRLMYLRYILILFSTTFPRRTVQYEVKTGAHYIETNRTELNRKTSKKISRYYFLNCLVTESLIQTREVLLKLAF